MTVFAISASVSCSGVAVPKQGRKPAKSKLIVHKDLAFDDIDDAMDCIETEDAHDKGTVKDSEETRVSTAEPKDGNSDESAALTTIFKDDETIAQFMVTMSQNKTKQKGVEIKEIKDTDRPRIITERSILTLKKNYRPPLVYRAVLDL
ncbi:hypothetical protein Tco_0986074 [Tanacetum coccineum]